MPQQVFVHIGPHKTGTTFVQQVLEHNRSVLHRGGVLFAGDRYRDQREAVLGLIHEARRSGFDASSPPEQWAQMARQIREWSGQTAIVSVENLCRANPSAIQVIVESLAPADVHVIYTARDLTQVIPAMWHTTLRNRDTKPWSEYILRIRTAEDTSRWPGELRGQDPRRVLPSWQKFVPPERIHVVTVPPPGSEPDVLWRRFCSVAGLRPERFALDVPRQNKSLGSAESELLRLLNVKVADSISQATYNRWVQVFIARRVLERRPDQQKFGLPAEDVPRIREYANAIVEFLEGSPYDVTGELGELLPDDARPDRVAPDAAEDSQVLDAAVDTLGALLVKVDKTQRRRSAGRSSGKGRWSPTQRMVRAVKRRMPRRLGRR